MAKHQIKTFKLVEFTNEATRGDLKSIECLPSSWIDYDEKLCSCVARYMEPPYSAEDLNLLKRLIKDCVPAPEGWPQYTVVLKGDAKTYSEGMNKLRKLEIQPFTTDSESRGKEKSKKMTDLYKSQMKIDKMLSVSSEGSSSDTSNSVEPPKQLRTKRMRIEDSPDSSSSSAVFKQMSKILPNSKKPSATRKKSTQSAILRNAPTDDENNNYRTPDSVARPSTSKFEASDVPCTRMKAGNGSRDISNTTERSASTLDSLVQELNNFKANKEHPLSKTDNLNDVEGSQDLMLNNSMKTMSKNVSLLYVAVKKLTLEVTGLRDDQQMTRNTIERLMHIQHNQVSILAFTEKYNFQQISSPEEFGNFDSELKNNEQYAKDFKDALQYLIESNMNQTIIAVIKKFLHRDFAMNCTAMKQSSNKLVLKGTCFYDSIFDLVCRFHRNKEGGNITEKIFYQSLSSCLTNSKDWNGNRKLRQSVAKNKNHK